MSAAGWDVTLFIAGKLSQKVGSFSKNLKGMIKLLLLILILCLPGCTFYNLPVMTCNEEQFIITPVILKNRETYILKYQLKISDSSTITQRPITDFKITDTILFFYFSGNTSFREYGNIVEREIKDLKAVKAIKNGNVYWRNCNRMYI